MSIVRIAGWISSYPSINPNEDGGGIVFSVEQHAEDRFQLDTLPRTFCTFLLVHQIQYMLQ